MEALIDLRHITVRFGDYTVLDDVTVSFPTGDTTFVIGPSGAGKSTLLKVAAGLVPPDAGEALVGNKCWSKMDDQEIREFRLYAAFVFQDSALWANMSILNNVCLPLEHHFPRMSVQARRKRALAALERVGYAENVDYRPAELSSGEQKLVAFARALALDPQLLFLDAPLSLVDGANATRLVDLCRELKAQRRSLVVVTNKLEFCCELADRVVVLDRGRIAADAELADLVGDWPAAAGVPSQAARAALTQRFPAAVGTGVAS